MQPVPMKSKGAVNGDSFVMGEAWVNKSQPENVTQE